MDVVTVYHWHSMYLQLTTKPHRFAADVAQVLATPGLATELVELHLQGRGCKEGVYYNARLDVTFGGTIAGETLRKLTVLLHERWALVDDVDTETKAVVYQQVCNAMSAGPLQVQRLPWYRRVLRWASSF